MSSKKLTATCENATCEGVTWMIHLKLYNKIYSIVFVEDVNFLRFRMYKSSSECPEKAARCSMGYPSRVVNRWSAPYFTNTFAKSRSPSTQDCCKAVRPSRLYWFIFTSVECSARNRSILVASFVAITISHWFWSFWHFS